MQLKLKDNRPALLLLYNPVISLKDQSTAPPIMSHWIHPFWFYAEESSLEKNDQLVFVYEFGVGDSNTVILLSLYRVTLL